MGDTGSLSLGGAFGIVAVLIHQPVVLVIAGGVFVAEAVSVMLQTGWFKYTRMRTGTGRRIFLMAVSYTHLAPIRGMCSPVICFLPSAARRLMAMRLWWKPRSKERSP